VIVDFIDQHKTEFGVEPVCAVLKDAGVQIAPSTYCATKTRPPSARSISDAANTALIGRVHAGLGRRMYCFGVRDQLALNCFLRVDVCRYRNMMAPMARAATTSDVFNAIAEPQRREILVLLRAGERPVTELAQELGMTQPGASKHLRVLREVGLVRDRKAGKQRLYGLDARGLRPVHEWTGGFERFWNESFDRLDAYVQDLKQARQEE
jgi:DNA-binding transcriptional ArsR family regulator